MLASVTSETIRRRQPVVDLSTWGFWRRSCNLRRRQGPGPSPEAGGLRSTQITARLLSLVAACHANVLGRPRGFGWAFPPGTSATDGMVASAAAKVTRIRHSGVQIVLASQRVVASVLAQGRRQNVDGASTGPTGSPAQHQEVDVREVWREIAVRRSVALVRVVNVARSLALALTGCHTEASQRTWLMAAREHQAV